MPHEEQSYQEAVLVLPRMRVQNANAVSSPMTWGFPSITAFIGLMHALARRLPTDCGLEFRGVGVICHDHEAQVTEGGYTRAFRLSRNPVDKDGSTAAIVEEGRIHLDITLVFLVNLTGQEQTDSARQQLAQLALDTVAEMRIAGGSVFPAMQAGTRRQQRPLLQELPDTPTDQKDAFRRMSRRWLPGFALVARDDLLQSHLTTLQQTDADSTALDAWLDLSRLNHRVVRSPGTDSKTGEATETVEWITERPKGWTVPIPVGYAALSALHAAGTVANARDMTTPFRFVESVYSVGQWVSPHRLADLNDLLWYSKVDEPTGLYRCCNDYANAPSSTAHPALID